MDHEVGGDPELNGIMELGEESDQLDRDAFSSGNVVNVLDLFPFPMQDELAEEMEPAKEDGKAKLYLIIKYLKKLRKKIQEMQKTKELRSGSGSGGKYRRKYETDDNDEGIDDQDGKKKEGRQKNRFRFSAQFASKPRSNYECKICKFF